MSRRLRLGIAAAALALAGISVALIAANRGEIGSDHDRPTIVRNELGPRAELGLMTSLPLYWPIDAEFGAIAAGSVAKPWQRVALERGHDLRPLDTFSPMPDIDPALPDIDPLAGLERLAVIQPRGLTPDDNVALDNWIRKGGQALFVLDPLLTGQYGLALGDPRMPVASALLPPILSRWGLSMRIEESQDQTLRLVSIEGRSLFVSIAGDWQVQPSDHANCSLSGAGLLVRCEVGKGTVVLLADAAIFEHEVLESGDEHPIDRVLEIAFSQ